MRQQISCIGSREAMQLSRDVSQLSRDVSHLSRDVCNSSRDVSQLSRDESNLSRDVTDFLHNVVITNFETNGLPYYCHRSGRIFFFFFLDGVSREKDGKLMTGLHPFW